MLKKILLLALASTTVTAADAAISVSSSTANTISAAPGRLIDFEDGLTQPTTNVPISGFATSGTGYQVMNGSSSLGAAPAGDATRFLSVYGGNFKLLGSVGYGLVSLYWGSVDEYNYLDLLDAAGNTFATVSSATIQSGTWADGNQTNPGTNRRVSITSDSAIYGLNFRSNQAAFEADDVKFQAAVPEPASWAMMVLGFGALGAALRRRRRSALVAFG